MKRLVLLPLVLPLMLAACSSMPFGHNKEQEAEAARRAASLKKAPPSEYASDGSRRVEINGVEITRVEFTPGVSSATVENMAKQSHCTGGPGAGLVSDAGPVEMYRMACSDGRVFLARCELRQCKAVSLK
ncbi:hypothetical protein [Pseudoduganella ginsengisoli]|uniref:Lipoprotein n=1 Tax=Pseudoduganella ginsengisoli TaxID=1462440 RepID=A0A6L6QAV9_9BURK|nr:hypothetical protein [Pseudoduganella ginsengisoli]MTW06321.1 hypothetical protein [Pseudoduganella ginsengisoli]